LFRIVSSVILSAARIAETSDMVAENAASLENAITPIVCLDIPYLDEQIKELFQHDIEVSRCLFVFEPHSSIGTDSPLIPIEANHIAHQISFLVDYQAPVLYGGSVSPDIVTSYIDEPDISGVLVGADSLNPSLFAEIINLV
jgi:triosephosphate isomerase